VTKTAFDIFEHDRQNYSDKGQIPKV